MTDFATAWKTIVDQAIALGADPADIPTGQLEADFNGDKLTFRSNYKGRR